MEVGASVQCGGGVEVSTRRALGVSIHESVGSWPVAVV